MIQSESALTANAKNAPLSNEAFFKRFGKENRQPNNWEIDKKFCSERLKGGEYAYLVDKVTKEARMKDEGCSRTELLLLAKGFKPKTPEFQRAKQLMSELFLEKQIRPDLTLWLLKGFYPGPPFDKYTKGRELADELEKKLVSMPKDFGERVGNILMQFDQFEGVEDPDEPGRNQTILLPIVSEVVDVVKKEVAESAAKKKKSGQTELLLKRIKKAASGDAGSSPDRTTLKAIAEEKPPGYVDSRNRLIEEYKKVTGDSKSQADDIVEKLDKFFDKYGYNYLEARENFFASELHGIDQDKLINNYKYDPKNPAAMLAMSDYLLARLSTTDHNNKAVKVAVLYMTDVFTDPVFFGGLQAEDKKTVLSKCLELSLAYRERSGGIVTGPDAKSNLKRFDGQIGSQFSEDIQGMSADDLAEIFSTPNGKRFAERLVRARKPKDGKADFFYDVRKSLVTRGLIVEDKSIKDQTENGYENAETKKALEDLKKSLKDRMDEKKINELTENLIRFSNPGMTQEKSMNFFTKEPLATDAIYGGLSRLNFIDIPPEENAVFAIANYLIAKEKITPRFKGQQQIRNMAISYLYEVVRFHGLDKRERMMREPGKASDREKMLYSKIFQLMPIAYGDSTIRPDKQEKGERDLLMNHVNSALLKYTFGEYMGMNEAAAKEILKDLSPVVNTPDSQLFLKKIYQKKDEKYKRWDAHLLRAGFYVRETDKKNYELAGVSSNANLPESKTEKVTNLDQLKNVFRNKKNLPDRRNLGPTGDREHDVIVTNREAVSAYLDGFEKLMISPNPASLRHDLENMMLHNSVPGVMEVDAGTKNETKTISHFSTSLRGQMIIETNNISSENRFPLTFAMWDYAVSQVQKHPGQAGILLDYLIDGRVSKIADEYNRRRLDLILLSKHYDPKVEGGLMVDGPSEELVYNIARSMVPDAAGDNIHMLVNTNQDYLKALYEASDRSTFSSLYSIYKQKGWEVVLREGKYKLINREEEEIFASPVKEIKPGEAIKLGDILAGDNLIKIYQEYKNGDFMELDYTKRFERMSSFLLEHVLGIESIGDRMTLMDAIKYDLGRSAWHSKEVNKILKAQSGNIMQALKEHEIQVKVPTTEQELYELFNHLSLGVRIKVLQNVRDFNRISVGDNDGGYIPGQVIVFRENNEDFKEKTKAEDSESPVRKIQQKLEKEFDVSKLIMDYKEENARVRGHEEPEIMLSEVFLAKYVDRLIEEALGIPLAELPVLDHIKSYLRDSPTNHLQRLQNELFNYIVFEDVDVKKTTKLYLKFALGDLKNELVKKLPNYKFILEDYNDLITIHEAILADEKIAHDTDTPSSGPAKGGRSVL